MDLNEKVNQSIKLLKVVASTTDEPIELSYSGGKDSDVILRLAQMAGINYRAIYKNTTIDPPGTIKHCKDNGVEIVHPKESFFRLIEKNGNPSRFARFCCRKLKEYKILDNAIQGIRKCESSKRAKLYKEPIVCRMYSKKEHVNTILPILDWTDDDVSDFVHSENIICHPWYYNDGDFDVKKRIGCMGCPLASMKKRREVFKLYPKFLRLWIKHYSVFYYNQLAKGGCNTTNKFKDPYEVFVFTLFFNRMVDFDLHWNLFGSQSAKRMLEDYFKIDLS